MKTGIHPEFHNTRLVCACKNVIQVRSTRKQFDVDICNMCHPFFSGKKKLVDTEGRVERFRRKYTN